MSASMPAWPRRHDGGRRHGGRGGGMGGGGTVIDPPVGGLYSDPVEMGNPGIVDLEARIAPINVNGTWRQPDDLQRLLSRRRPSACSKGDTLKINLTNSLPATTATNILGYQKNITNLHTHGWHVSPEAPVGLRHVRPDARRDLQPRVRHVACSEPGTLNFYHPAQARRLGRAVLGRAGRGRWWSRTTTTVLAGYETHILVLKDITLSGTAPAPHSTMMDYMHGKEGNIVMVNGQVNPRLYLKTGQVQRWRILNASNARFYKLSLDGHTMHLIGTDGGLLDKPYPRSETPPLARRAGGRAGQGDQGDRATTAAGAALLPDGHDGAAADHHPDDRDLQRERHARPEPAGRRSTPRPRGSTRTRSMIAAAADAHPEHGAWATATSTARTST